MLARYTTRFVDKIPSSYMSYLTHLSVCPCVRSHLVVDSQCQQIADRLCIAIGQDILDCLFSRPTLVSLSRQFAFSLEYARPIWYMILAIIYTGELQGFQP
jgi:hypothetical protein